MHSSSFFSCELRIVTNNLFGCCNLRKFQDLLWTIMAANAKDLSETNSQPKQLTAFARAAFILLFLCKIQFMLIIE